MVTGGNSVGVVWSVDGVVGGTASSGTITTGGLYTPPSVAGVHTVTATSSDLSQSASATVYVTNYAGKFTHHNDNFRTGANLNEMVLTPATVNSATFGKLFTWQLDGTMHASALYVANVNIPGGWSPQRRLCRDGTRQRLRVRRRWTERDAAVEGEFHQSGGRYHDGSGRRHRRVLRHRRRNRHHRNAGHRPGQRYALRRRQDQGGFRRDTNYVQRLHALDIATGAEKFGGPVVIQASVPGTGTGSQGGQIRLRSRCARISDRRCC